MAGKGLGLGWDYVHRNVVHRTHSVTSRSQPCNPAVGGPAKSQLVHEVDAMGGEMGKMADRTYLQKRILNRSKGPAVWALRAQVWGCGEMDECEAQTLMCTC